MDWRKLFKLFNDLKSKQKLSVSEFAGDAILNETGHILNENTLRKHFAYLKKNDPIFAKEAVAARTGSEGKTTSKTPIKRGRKPAGAASSEGATKKAGGEKAKKTARRTPSKAPKGGKKEEGSDQSAPSNVITMTPLAGVRAKHKNPTERTAAPSEKVVPRGRPATTGVDASITTAGIEEAKQRVVPFMANANVEVSARLLAHLSLLETTQANTIKRIQLVERIMCGEITPEDDEWIDVTTSGIANPLLSLNQYVTTSTAMISDLLMKLHNIASRNFDAGLRLNKDVRDGEAHKAKHSPQVVKAAFELRKAKGWTATETAEWIVEQGVEIPPLMYELIKREVADGQTRSFTDTTEEAPAHILSPQELRARSRLRRDERMIELFKADRREFVAGVVDAGGYGDIDLLGRRREGEGETTSTAEDEIDWDLAREMYGEDFVDEQLQKE